MGTVVVPFSFCTFLFGERVPFTLYGTQVERERSDGVIELTRGVRSNSG